VRPGALLLTPGASADRNSSALVAIDAAVQPLPVARANLPKGTPAAVAAVGREAATLVEHAGSQPRALALGGRSFGGRMCSMAVAGGLASAALVLVSYPLHPPGRPEQLRVDHFPRLRVPCLFVSGTRDAFGTPAELEQHTATIPGKVTHVWIEGGDHGLRGRDVVVAEAVAQWLRSLR
jgi:predicted alpha/beta-hydrolase family hydrolase